MLKNSFFFNHSFDYNYNFSKWLVSWFNSCSVNLSLCHAFHKQASTLVPW
jgi:hypothetical protein